MISPKQKELSQLESRQLSLQFFYLILSVVLIIQISRLPTMETIDDLLIEGGNLQFVPWNFTPPRGSIYDRHGNLLAGNHTVYEVGVHLADVEDPTTIALATSAVLGLDFSYVYERVSIEASPNAIYVMLARNVSQTEVAELRNYLNEETLALNPQNAPSLDGLIYTAFLERSYPENDLAANLLGFVNQEERGYFGIEQYYNSLLAGEYQIEQVSRDPNQADNLPDIPPGASLILTIDREIQAMVEDIIDQAVDDYEAVSGTVIIMDPQTGEILAMASTPRLNLNQYWTYPDVFPGATPFNRAISQSFEPGSVFKVLTMAAALDSGTVDQEYTYFDPGLFQIGGITIRNWDLSSRGELTMTECLQYSSNVCFAHLGEIMGAGIFYEYMDAFGIGNHTGIDLANEATGRLKSPGDGDWYPADLGTNSFGQGVSVTPIQLMMAVSALANRGEMVVPHVVHTVINGDQSYTIRPQIAGQPISAETAEILSQMLAEALENETPYALVHGYQIAGKTGTAEIPTESGYTLERTNASFIGWGPLNDPEFLIYVWLEEPNTIWGSSSAAPVFAEITQRLVIMMDIPPDNVRVEMADD